MNLRFSRISLPIAIAISFQFTLFVSGATIAANSTERADVVAAINLASDGDTVLIPSGTSSWDEVVYVEKGITIQGSGIGNTILRDNVDRTKGRANQGLPNNASEAMFYFNTEAGKTYRLSGIQFEDDSGSRTKYWSGMVQLSGSSTECIVDNCSWLGFDQSSHHGRMIYARGSTLGVIHHCEFQLAGDQAITFDYSTYGGYVDGNGSWASPDMAGSAQMWYVEDCTLSGTDSGGLVDGVGGARFCIRYNNIINGHIASHGTESGRRNRGTRWIEVYENTYSHPLTGSSNNAVTFRSGSGVVYNNTGTGSNFYTVNLQTYRTHDSYPPWGGADGANPFDYNDLTDGPSTPGGAGDGVFESGIASGGGDLLLKDSGKSWIPNQWAGFTVRSVQASGIASSGSGAGKLVDANASWTVDFFASKFQIKNLTTGRVSKVFSNTSNTINFNFSSSVWSFNPGDKYEISRYGIIESNTLDTLMFGNSVTDKNDADFSIGEPYNIRKVITALDMAGAGQSIHFTGGMNPDPIDFPNQTISGVYEWGNSFEGQVSPVSYSGIHQLGVHIHVETEKPGYIPYRYPHPLVTGEPIFDTIIAPSGLELGSSQ